MRCWDEVRDNDCPCWVNDGNSVMTVKERAYMRLAIAEELYQSMPVKNAETWSECLSEAYRIVIS